MSIESCFENCRTSAGSPGKRQFDQGSVISKLSASGALVGNYGRCGGVSLAYLGLLKGKDNIFMVDMANEGALFKFLNVGHGLIDKATMEACDFESAAGQFGMQVKARAISFLCPVTTSLPTWVTENAGYYLIGTPNHYCAAVKTNTSLRFFDPNTGDVTYGPDDDANYIKFVSSYLSAGEVATLYQLKSPNKVYLTWMT